MDGTDRHCRFFHRLMTKRARLYTEMITAEAALHGDRDHLLGFDDSEHPVALQLGDSEFFGPAVEPRSDSLSDRLVALLGRTPPPHS